MQAIILAAGMGRRLGEKTQDRTKCMIEVNGEKLIDRMLGQLKTLPLKRIIMVIGYQGENLMNYIREKYKDTLHIIFVNNPVYDKTNNIYSLSLAKEYLKEDDTILLESDLIFDESMLHLIMDDPYPNLALVAKYESWMDGTMVKINDNHHIINFIAKKDFQYEQAEQYYKTVNIYKFSQDFLTKKYVPFLEAYCQALGNNEYYEQVLRVIAFLDNGELKALPVGNLKWYEIDDVQDLDIAETIFADKQLMMHRFNARYGGHWRFPKMKDFCYLVNPFFPTKKMVSELKANFDNLLTEYPSGMFVNSFLAAKNFHIRQDYVVVGNGAAELIKSLMENLKGNIGVIYPTFEEYPHRCDTLNIIPFFVSNESLSYSADNIMRFYEDKDINNLLIINPDNPSGNFIPKDDLLTMATWCEEKNINLIVDESFVDFSDHFQYNTLLRNDMLELHPNLIVLKSISKSYGVPGIRLGILATANTPLIRWMKKDIAIWNINSFAEYYMQIYGKYENDYIHACQLFAEERKRFFNRLKEIPFIRVIPSQANYFLCQITDKYTAEELTSILLYRFDILVKNCDEKTSLKGKNYLRISIRNQQDNDYLVECLKKCI